MYHNLEKYIKDDPKNVTSALKALMLQTAKYETLKLNITIQVDGFGWDWCKHAWSKNGNKYSVKTLANHL